MFRAEPTTKNRSSVHRQSPLYYEAFDGQGSSMDTNSTPVPDGGTHGEVAGRALCPSEKRTLPAFTEKLFAVCNVRGSALHSLPHHNTTKPFGFLKCHCVYPETWLRQGNYPFLSPFLIPTCLKRSAFTKSVNQCPRKCFWLPAPTVKPDNSRDSAGLGRPAAGDLHEAERV